MHRGASSNGKQKAVGGAGKHYDTASDKKKKDTKNFFLSISKIVHKLATLARLLGIT